MGRCCVDAQTADASARAKRASFKGGNSRENALQRAFFAVNLHFSRKFTTEAQRSQREAGITEILKPLSRYTVSDFRRDAEKAHTRCPSCLLCDLCLSVVNFPFLLVVGPVSLTKWRFVNVNIRQMTIADYAAVMSLLNDTAGVQLRQADSREATERYLTRNPGLSFVAVDGDELVGCIMCGHDGRRGYLQHLAVAQTHRCRGIGSALVEKCLIALGALGIFKTHIDVLVTNTDAVNFWTARGWEKRDDIHRFSFVNSHDPNA